MGNPYAPTSQTKSKNDDAVETTATEKNEVSDTTVEVEDRDEIFNSSISKIVDWVGDDKDRAGQALAAEQEKSEPRKSLVKSLKNTLDE